MSKPVGILVTCLSLLLSATAWAQPPATGPAGVAGNEPAPVALPSWQVLGFEEKAYWATAKSRLEILPNEEDETLWDLEILSSVVSNSEQIDIVFEPATARVVKRSRLSRGSGQRMKSYEYDDKSVLRERRNRSGNTPPEEWPVSSSKTLSFPESAANTVVTSPYLLPLLAGRLQAQGNNKSQEVLVHTDQNFYRVRLTTGRGPSIDADYKAEGGEDLKGSRETNAVAVQATPEGELDDDEDFSLFGMQGDIIILFDRETGLPLQVRGEAPRIGDTSISLRAVTMRQADQ